MEAKYKITEDDYVGAMRLFSKFTPKIIALYLLIVGVLVVAAVLGPSVVKAGAIGGIVGGGVVTVLGRLLSPLIARRQYRKYKSIQDSIHIKLEDDGIRLSNVDGDALVKWEKILKWRQNDDYLLIYPMPRMYHIIPKSIQESGFSLLPLIEALETNVGNET